MAYIDRDGAVHDNSCFKDMNKKRPGDKKRNNPSGDGNMPNRNEVQDELAIIEAEALLGRQACLSMHVETQGYITGVFITRAGRLYRFEWFDPEDNIMCSMELDGCHLSLL